MKHEELKKNLIEIASPRWVRGMDTSISRARDEKLRENIKVALAAGDFSKDEYIAICEQICEEIRATYPGLKLAEEEIKEERKIAAVRLEVISEALFNEHFV